MASFLKKILRVPVVGVATVGMVVGAIAGVPYAGIDATIGAIRGKRVSTYYGFKHTVLSGSEDAGSLFADVGGWHQGSVGAEVQKDYVAPALNGAARLTKATAKPGQVIGGVDCRGPIPGTTDELAGTHASWGDKGPVVVHNHYANGGPFQVGFTYIEVPAGTCTGGDQLVVPANPITPSAGIVNAMVPPPP